MRRAEMHEKVKVMEVFKCKDGICPFYTEVFCNITHDQIPPANRIGYYGEHNNAFPDFCPLMKEGILVMPRIGD